MKKVINTLYFFMVLVYFMIPGENCLADKLEVDAHSATTPQGISYLYMEKHDLPMVELMVAFKKAGYAYDPESKQGLARLVSFTMPRGKVKDGEVQSFIRALGEHGVELWASVDRENLYISLKTLSENLKFALSMLGDCLALGTVVNEGVLEEAKHNQKASIHHSVTNPQAVAMMGLYDMLLPGHPYSYRAYGRLEMLDSITVSDVRSYVEESLDLDQMFISVVGDVKEQELSLLLDDSLSRLRRGQNQKVIAKSEPRMGKRGYIKFDNVPQSVIAFAGKSLAQSDPRYNVMQLLNRALGGMSLGSTLMKELRQKLGITYHIGSMLSDDEHADLLLGYLYTDSATAGKGVEALLDVVRFVKENGLDRQVFDEAKADMLSAFVFSLTSMNTTAGLLLHAQLIGEGIDYIQNYSSRFDAITLADVNALAKDVLGDLSIVEVGKQNNIKGEAIGTSGA